MYPNSPTDGIDGYGQLSTGLDFDNLLTQYIDKGLIHGYSVARKLVNISSNLQAFRVRRSSDNAEQDIGFIGDSVDTTSLLSFVGANNGLVKTIYDQIGSSDGTQSTNADQWRNVLNGTLVTSNGKPILDHYSSLTDSFYTLSSSFNLSDLTVFFVFLRGAQAGFVSSIKSSNGNSECYYLASQNELRLRVSGLADNDNAKATVGLTDNQLYSACVLSDVSTSNVSFWLDNSFITTSSPVTSFSGDFITEGIFRSGVTNDYRIAEVLVFNRVLSESDRYNVNKNINNFYGI